LFISIAAATMGVINKDFLCDLGRRITHSTDDHRETAFLFQRLSVLIQRYNAVAVLGRLPSPHDPRGRNAAVTEFVPVFSLVLALGIYTIAMAKNGNLNSATI